MRETLIILLKQAHDAQRFINQKGRGEIKSVLRNFIQDISSMISQYVKHVEYRVSSILTGLLHSSPDGQILCLSFLCRSKMKLADANRSRERIIIQFQVYVMI